MNQKKTAVARVLVVDDEALIRWSLGEQLTHAGYDVAEAATGAEALAALHGETAPFDLVLLDLKLPDTDGLRLLRHIRETRPRCRVIMMSAFATPQDVDEARQGGVAEIIAKPFDVDALLRAVERELHGL